jgi:hypothetical protein
MGELLDCSRLAGRVGAWQRWIAVVSPAEPEPALFLWRFFGKLSWGATFELLFELVSNFL